MATFETANYALVEVKPYRRNLGITVNRTNIGGTSTFALMLPFGGYTLVYSILAYASSAVRNVSQLAGLALLAERPLVNYLNLQDGVLTAAAFGAEPVPGMGRAYAAIVKVATDRSTRLSDMGYSWRRSAVTGLHHSWFRPEEVIRAAPHTRRIDLAAALARLANFEETEAFATGLMLWASAAGTDLVRAVMRSTLLWASQSLDSWIKQAKSCTADMKMHQHLMGARLEHLFELQVLANRGIGAVNWTDEESGRLRPDLVSVPPGEVRRRATAILMQGVAEGATYASESWPDFWSRRWASTPSGSVHSQYAADEAYIDHGLLERTKHYTVVKMPDVTADHFTDRLPEIRAWPSVKYEWAKNRAIYGTDLTSYILTDFAMPAVEETLSHVFPVGRKANEGYVSARIKLASADGVAMCLDYADFNSQHSLQSMFEVLQAYKSVFSMHMSIDQLKAIDWVLISVWRQTVEAKEPYRTSGTLLSGWRLTTFMNTLLNRIYLEVCGATDSMRDSVHNGDDVLAYVNTVQDAVDIFRKAASINIRTQASKNVVAGLEEFLRVDRASPDPSGAQYLTRACATAVHARAESGVPEEALTYLEAQITRIGEVRNRSGADELCTGLLVRAKERATEIFEVPEEVVAAAFVTHRVHGGLSSDPDLEPECTIVRIPLTVFNTPISKFAMMPGVRAYARYLTNLFKLEPRVKESIIYNIARATRKLITLTRHTLEYHPVQGVGRARVAQYLTGIHSDDFITQAYSGKARLAGVPVGRIAIREMSSIAMARIRSSDDPIRTMQIVF